ncbi:hypothetical protein KM427_15920 [Nocardioides sp. LMS-CY]|uniref:hypothetical protein n=1 Tax=Nocardioides sp. (strain LMS-CY) TaxID=2840457 RepID=UPI001C000DD7|nr:hypothetical protein [Nocardioides sp. LMS-CY]QWF20469.1 hypothetical protein KM427_15920 [Nocardioides sp. LMS-CY]
MAGLSAGSVYSPFNDKDELVELVTARDRRPAEQLNADLDGARTPREITEW